MPENKKSVRFFAFGFDAKQRSENSFGGGTIDSTVVDNSGVESFFFGRPPLTNFRNDFDK